jgi:hypothetical protein
MTTVDVRVERWGSGDRRTYTTACGGRRPESCTHSAGPARMAGSPSRKWNIAEINEVTTGDVVRQALDSIEDLDWQHSWDSTDRERVTAFRDRLVDSAEYEIHALEV